MTIQFYSKDGQTGKSCAVLLSSALRVEWEKLEKFHKFIGFLTKNEGVTEFRFTQRNCLSAYADALRQSPVRRIVYTHHYDSPDSETLREQYSGFSSIINIAPKSRSVRGQYIQVLQAMLKDAGYVLFDSSDTLASADGAVQQQIKKYPQLKLLDMGAAAEA